MIDLIIIVACIIAMVAWGVIIRKAGYSRLWLFVALIPVVNYFMLILFACSDWPILRELRFQTLSKGTANPKDGEKFLNDALKFELRGDTQEALLRYEKIQNMFVGTPIAEDARISIETLKEKISQQPTVANGVNAATESVQLNG